MRILVVAYEFPPSSSPGSLRWRYLARELAKNGHEVEVLAPKLPGAPSSPVLAASEGITTVRTFAGPLVGLLEWHSRRKATHASNESRPGEFKSGKDLRPNWKYRLVQSLLRATGFFLYPDSRAEWRPWAEHALRKRIELRRPDIVVCAHEPATTLELGLAASGRGIPWVADLGDPVLAPYTPRRWRRRASQLEEAICKSASRVVVTTGAAKELLMRRHVVSPGMISVMTQGFEDRGTVRCPSDCAEVEFDPQRLEILYSGRFYAFRKPDHLLAAVVSMEGVRLSILSPELPDEYAHLVASSNDKVRYLGNLSHLASLELQRRADVLVSIGNDGLEAQTPGKIYEYLGSGRPVLHLLAQGADPCRDLLEPMSMGFTCANAANSVRHSLEMLVESKHNGLLPRAGTADQERVAAYGWGRIGSRYSALLEDVLAECGVEKSSACLLEKSGARKVSIDDMQQEGQIANDT